MRTVPNFHVNRGAALGAALGAVLEAAPVCPLGYALVLAKNMETIVNGLQMMVGDTVANVSMINGAGVLAVYFVQKLIIKATIQKNKK